jgi:thioredoxin reductase
MSRLDVAIVGGGPAGLAAALVLGRMRRRVLLLDADDPAHAPSEGVHGLFGHDGTPPLELRRLARQQLRPYESVTVRMVAAEAVRKTPGGFSVLADGEQDIAGVLLLATGVRYELPPIEGAAEVWARGVFHCPYCHGWEVRDRPLAAYGTDAAGLALLLTSLSRDVVLLTDGDSNLDPDDERRLTSAGVEIRGDRVAGLEAEGGRLARIRFADGWSDDRAGLFYAPRFTPSPLPAQLGCELDEGGMMVIDDDCRTSVPGVFAAGDATVGKAAVVLAAAAGSRAAYAINAELAHGTLPGGSRLRRGVQGPAAGRKRLARYPDSDRPRSSSASSWSR